MPYTDIPVENFAGLNIIDDPQQVGLGAAVDAVNVNFDHNGRLRTRDGYSAFATTAAITLSSIAPYTDTSGGVFQLVTGDGSHLYAYNATTGALVNSLTASSIIAGWTMFGTPNATSLLIPTSGGVVRWDGSAFSTYTLTAAAGSGVTIPNQLMQTVALSTNDNRVFWGQQPSTVFFSDAGAANSIVGSNQLTPGDGETITAMASYQGLVFVFKQSKFFVFYGTGTTSTGTPSFNYRTVLGRGATFSGSTGGAVSTPYGVFFVAKDGVYQTTGGEARLVSGALSPLFSEGTLQANATNILTTDGNRLYLSLSQLNTSTGAYIRGWLYVMDLRTGLWTRWSLAVGTQANYYFGGLGDSSIPNQTTFFVASGASSIFKMAPGLTADGAFPITWSYTSGTTDMGTGETKALREIAVSGKNPGGASINLGIAVDNSTSYDSTAITLPTTLGVDVRQRVARRAEYFSFKLDGTTSTEINRLVFRMRDTGLPR